MKITMNHRKNTVKNTVKPLFFSGSLLETQFWFPIVTAMANFVSHLRFPGHGFPSDLQGQVCLSSWKLAKARRWDAVNDDGYYTWWVSWLMMMVIIPGEFHG